MKNLLLTSTTILTLTLAHGQINFYFQNNPVWQVNSACAIPYPCIQKELKNYYLNGDTIINAITYKQVFKKGQGFFDWMAPQPVGCSGSYWYIDSVPALFLRSIGQQMFLRQPLDTNEYLLYDFNLAIGDTLPITYNNPQNNIYVSAIDSIFTPYGYRKRFELTGNTSSQYIIEGIGSMNGLIEPIGVILECGHSLWCYSLNDTAYYPTTGPTCNLNVGIMSYENNNFNFSISPNPFSSYTVLQSYRILDNTTITVENCLGQTVKRINNISGQSFIIPRDNLSAGLYFIYLTEYNRIIGTNKLLIID